VEQVTSTVRDGLGAVMERDGRLSDLQDRFVAADGRDDNLGDRQLCLLFID
jgi:hypothetical protein